MSWTQINQKVSLVLFSILIPILSFGQDAAQAEMGLDDRINEWFTPISQLMQDIVLHNFPGSAAVFGQPVPSIIILLVAGATFFTFYFGFVNIRRFGLAINVVRGLSLIHI